ncbi:MAG: hypothetical protein GC160_08660 [Acidobacteria bacterium]|nr:hypothetical protein [Acidobacteriota bacterium]
MFRGLQTGRVDDKNRLKMPALVRKNLLEKYGSPDVFITSLDERDVKIFPIAEWEVLERRLSEKTAGAGDLDGERKNKILFLANHYGAEQSLDAQGRILIPGALREGPGMRGEISLLWQSNHILALSAERYKEKTAEAKMTDADKAFAQNLGF